MPPYGIIFLDQVLPVVITTGGILTGLWLVLRAWTANRGVLSQDRMAKLIQHSEANQETLELIHEALEDMRADMRARENDVRELSGRVEFAERMLANPREKASG